MKRILSAIVLAGLATLSVAAPSQAASVTKNGAVKMTWNVALTASLGLFTQYTEAAAPAQGSGTPNLQPSAAGVCTGAGSESPFTLTYGGIAPAAAGYVGCNYKDAVAALVTTNSTNWAVTEFLDAAPSPAAVICGFKDAATGTSSSAPVSPNGSAPAAYSGTTCATGGAVIPAAGGTTTVTAVGGSGVATFSAGPVAPGSPFAWCSGTTAGATSCGEDIQVNIAANQAATATQTSYVVVQLIAN